MVCYCIPIVCSCDSDPLPIAIPENLPEPIPRVMCPRCGVIGNTEYCRMKNSCTLCFCIPCPCGHSNPFLACRNCKYNFTGTDITKCKKCRIGYTFHSQFCPECGERN